MGNDKTNVFLLAIVGIVAVAGLVFLCSEKGNATTEDSISGEAFWSATSNAVGINHKDYFTLTDADGKVHLYQYKGGDSPLAESPKIALKEIETGETIIVNYIWQDYAGGVKPTLVVGNPGEPCSAQDSSGCLKTNEYAFKFKTNTNKANQQLLVYRFLENGEMTKLSFNTGTLKLPK